MQQLTREKYSKRGFAFLLFWLNSHPDLLNTVRQLDTVTEDQQIATLLMILVDHVMSSKSVAMFSPQQLSLMDTDDYENKASDATAAVFRSFVVVAALQRCDFHANYNDKYTLRSPAYMEATSIGILSTLRLFAGMKMYLHELEALRNYSFSNILQHFAYFKSMCRKYVKTCMIHTKLCARSFTDNLEFNGIKVKVGTETTLVTGLIVGTWVVKLQDLFFKELERILSVYGENGKTLLSLFSVPPISQRSENTFSFVRDFGWVVSTKHMLIQRTLSDMGSFRVDINSDWQHTQVSTGVIRAYGLLMAYGFLTFGPVPRGVEFEDMNNKEHECEQKSMFIWYTELKCMLVSLTSEKFNGSRVVRGLSYVFTYLLFLFYEVFGSPTRHTSNSDLLDESGVQVKWRLPTLMSSVISEVAGYMISSTLLRQLTCQLLYMNRTDAEEYVNTFHTSFRPTMQVICDAITELWSHATPTHRAEYLQFPAYLIDDGSDLNKNMLSTLVARLYRKEILGLRHVELTRDSKDIRPELPREWRGNLLDMARVPLDENDEFSSPILIIQDFLMNRLHKPLAAKGFMSLVERDQRFNVLALPARSGKTLSFVCLAVLISFLHMKYQLASLPILYVCVPIKTLGIAHAQCWAVCFLYMTPCLILRHFQYMMI